MQYTETSIDEARTRLQAVRERCAQAEAQAQAELSNRMVGYMQHDARSRHMADINARVNQAKEELRAAQAHLDTMLRDPLAQMLAARKRARAIEEKRTAEQEARQAEHAKGQEAQAKEEFRARYLASGGTPAQFEAAWPAMWSNELDRRTSEAQDALKQRLIQSGRYNF